jgi:hypothetical protein
MSLGIISSRIETDDANEVLISGRNCGSIASKLPTNKDEMAAIESQIYLDNTQKASEYLKYAYKCYRAQGARGTRNCNTFVRPTLPYSKNLRAACPFDSKICRLAENNLHLDTGYLDGHKHFGLNGGPQFSLRLARQCAPLETNNYTKVNQDNTQTPARWMQYYYGKSKDGQRPYSYSLRMNTSRVPTEETDLLVGEDYRIT